jgi:hypothetical protein
MSSLFGEPTDAERERWRIGEQIRRGADDPIEIIRRAVRHQNVARNVAREEADRARGVGVSWAEIAAAAGIKGEGDYDAGVKAFEWAAPKPADRFDRVWASWTCSTCGGRVIENHPDSGAHPVDREEGHAEGCARFAADVEAYEREAGFR